jgi:hypothetical protein
VLRKKDKYTRSKGFNMSGYGTEEVIKEKEKAYKIYLDSNCVEFFIHEYTLYTVAVSLVRGSKERC